MRRLYVVSFLLLIRMLSLAAQADAGISSQEVAHELNKSGLENVSVAVTDSCVYASFTDVTYRGTYRGAAEAIKIINGFYPRRIIRIAVFENMVPKVAISACLSDSVWNIRVGYDSKEITRKLTESALVGKSYGKVDVSLYPIVTFQNNRLDKLCEYSVSFAPSFETTLWWGNRIYLQPVLPVIHNLERGNTNRYIHIGAANIRQDFVNSARWHATAALGFFLGDRVGAHAEIGYRLNGYIDVTAQMGYTGAAYVDNNGFTATNWNRVNAMMKLDYYESYTGMRLSVSGGRFLYGDYGVRVDVARHYSDYSIGLFGILTEGEHNAGFCFAIPFGGKSQRRDGFVRVRLPQYFDWQYNMVSYYEYEWNKMGRQYETRPDENYSAHYWKAAYIETYIKKCLDGSVN
ncbi:YjbH domain-containing protein [Xylanibacter muris]|uniref:Bacterial lipoprotein (DUF940) n=1 Tax=Xylanibacter muris TaxID=2736290 RepID=A0ABX2ASZ6_9BACT|nr:YjbH domain-containing protein [Xylanibacter muris]NPD93071.1 hypothetical protein [Xylanibacter muris]